MLIFSVNLAVKEDSRMNFFTQVITIANILVYLLLFLCVCVCVIVYIQFCILYLTLYWEHFLNFIFQNVIFKKTG